MVCDHLDRKSEEKYWNVFRDTFHWEQMSQVIKIGQRQFLLVPQFTTQRIQFMQSQWLLMIKITALWFRLK